MTKHLNGLTAMTTPKMLSVNSIAINIPRPMYHHDEDEHFCILQKVAQCRAYLCNDLSRLTIQEQWRYFCEYIELELPAR